MIILKNANVYAPKPLGTKDLLLGSGKILLISDCIDSIPDAKIVDLQNKFIVPGFIDQHVHLTGAGGKHGFASMTPEIKVTDLVKNGITSVVGLLGTDGATRSLKSLYAKVKALNQEGVSAFMHTGYYGIDPVHLMKNVQEDLIYIDAVLGCKIAISDVRSSYPSDRELLRLLRHVKVGGMIARKKGILHVHLGNLESKMDSLFRIVKDHQFPIEHISPTHVGRTEDLFEQAIQFAKIGGIIDITTGASKYTEPYKSVIYALEKEVAIDKLTFSSDGNAGLDKLDAQGNLIGFRCAPISESFIQVKHLLNEGISMQDAISIITLNPAINLGLNHKGRIEIGADADICVLDNAYSITDVFAHGSFMMHQGKLTVKNSF
tara:strand:+ start:328 stop:1458 length:1131 start_codon:yes stop_codon:yes gene_type:complete